MADSRRYSEFSPVIAVIGDFMVDVYHIGEASGLSAEVPIPVVKVKNELRFPGGAGNVAENIRALGGVVEPFAGVGTPYKHRLMVGDHQVARWDENDSCRPLSLYKFPFVEAVIVADYGKGSVNEKIIAEVKNISEIVPVFVDTKRDPSVWSGIATAIFPNMAEFDKFPDKYAGFNGNVVLKNGKDGLEFWTKDKNVVYIPAKARFVRSVNGAGDSVIAAFAYKYLWFYLRNGQDLDSCELENVLDFASGAAAIAVEHPYTYAPTFEEVDSRYLDL